MSPDDPRHGSSAGYLAETKAGVPHCQPCRDARAYYQRWREYDKALGRPRKMPAHGARRRIRSLQRLGWSLSMIAAEAGWNSPEALQYVMRSKSVTRKSWLRISDVYERLSMTLPPFNSATVRARLRAERLGYPPPLAWDNIDDENERPKGVGTSRTDRADVLADIDSWGGNATDACRALGIDRRTLQKWAGNHGCSELYRRLAGREAMAANQYAKGGVA